MKNKFKLATSIAFLVTILIIFLYTFISFCKSCDSYNDGWGTDFFASNDMLYYSVASLILLIFAIYALVKTIKNKSLGFAPHISCGIASFILFGYEMGYFTKQMGKGKAFNDYKEYLIFGIIYLAITVVIVLKYFADRKENN